MEKKNKRLEQARIFVPVFAFSDARKSLTNKGLASIILRSDIDKGNEKEEYITRLPREKYPLAERCFEDRLMEGSF